MKVSFLSQNNKFLKPQKQKIAFGAGLTPKMMQEIQQADVCEISSRLADKGIPTDFNDNKIIAWCSEKTVDIFEQLNKNYKLKLALPKGIFVEDFSKLKIDDPNNTYGFCNLFPTPLQKNSNERTSAKILFFNNFKTSLPNIPEENKWRYNWDFINEIADAHYASKLSSSDHFLYTFFHEFSHVLHEDQLLKKFKWKDLLKKTRLITKEEQIQEFKEKYGTQVSKICDYAAENQFEATACDIPRRIISILDPNTLIPKQNPFKDTPYEKLSFLQKWKRQLNNKKQEIPLDEILRNFWNGKFE